MVSCPTANTAQVGSVVNSPAMTVTGGTAPFNFTVVGTLPAGLSLNPSTGSLSGTPTAPGTFSVEATDANGIVATKTTLPTGTVAFTDTNTGTLLGSAAVVTSGSAGITKTGASLAGLSLAAGSFAVQAAYSGDNTYSASTSPLVNQVVQSTSNATTTTLTADNTLVVAGQSITLTAVVSSTGGVPTGIVSFSDGTTLLAALRLDATGQAILTTSALAVGPHTITAAYSGDINNAISASSLNATVQASSGSATTITVNSSADPASPGVPLTLAATVSSATPGLLTGTVTFQDQSSTPPTQLGSGPVPVQNGVATVSFLPGRRPQFI